MRKRILLLLVAVLCVSLCACGNKVDNLISEIATLENKEITLADKERIEKIYDKYLALSEEEKAQITNYDVLKEADEVIVYYTIQEDTLNAAPKAVEEYAKSYCKIPSTMQVIKSETYPAKNDNFVAFVRLQFTAENSFGGKVEETLFAKVYCGATTQIKEYHFGDAHETWDDVGWADWIMEGIDFENKYIPNK